MFPENSSLNFKGFKSGCIKRWAEGQVWPIKQTSFKNFQKKWKINHHKKTFADTFFSKKNHRLKNFFSQKRNFPGTKNFFPKKFSTKMEFLSKNSAHRKKISFQMKKKEKVFGERKKLFFRKQKTDIFFPQSWGTFSLVGAKTCSWWLLLSSSENSRYTSNINPIRESSVVSWIWFKITSSSRYSYYSKFCSGNFSVCMTPPERLLASVINP